MNKVIISNTCVGWVVINHMNILPYNNPFISVLIPNDEEFIKLSNNFLYYINSTPRLGEPKMNTSFYIQNKSPWYKHVSISIPYPVIHLDDIEIHCIHELDENECLDKFNKRLTRLREVINENDYTIYILLSFSELINDHDNLQELIDGFLYSSDNNIKKYFMGPSKYKNNNSNYISIEKWDNIPLVRDDSYIYNFNDQFFNASIFENNIFI